MRSETKPSSVPLAAKQGGESRAQKWVWVQSCVWTERMLQALEKGVKGGKWYSLMDKVYSKRNLEAAYRKVRSNRGSEGVDHVTLEMFEEHRESNLQYLHDQLRDGSYRPQAIRRVFIPKSGSKEQRPLGIPTVRDRVVQTALRNVLEPIFERDFAEHSYGFRPKRSCKDALRRVEQLLKRGHRWVVDVDFKSYFDTIPHASLMSLLRRKVADNRVLQLVEAYLDQQILEGTCSWSPEAGTPQGAVASPLLANIYLDPLDHLMVQQRFEMIRYADDLVVMCRDENEAQRALSAIRLWTESAGLALHPTKTRIADLRHPDGFEFLGYHFQPVAWKPSGILRRPRKKSLRKFKDTVRSITKRNNGHSMATIITMLNPVVRGFFEYFKHVDSKLFGSLDGWIRMRLRSILRRRLHQRGRGRGKDHQRWPNAYFGEHGLFFMAGAWVQLSQSK